LIVKVADSAPSTLGLNVTLRVHAAPAAKLVGSVPHVLVWEKSAELAPVNPMLEMFSDVNCLFLKVKVSGLLGVLMATLWKLYALGASVASATPVPLRGEVNVL
jgi:hypothetical protein